MKAKLAFGGDIQRYRLEYHCRACRRSRSGQTIVGNEATVQHRVHEESQAVDQGADVLLSLHGQDAFGRAYAGAENDADCEDPEQAFALGKSGAEQHQKVLSEHQH